MVENKNLNQDKVLDVKNLRISFKTNGGTVKAVRGISFSLYKGRTLAIVGESGSGKSVTSKAILGILANNKIIEDGQIIYEGKDLLKLSEDQFTKLRGVKISMIFQDPLSSLNPIMKVGKQLTEAMILKSKATVKEARKILNRFNKVLKVNENFSSFEKLLKENEKLTLDERKKFIEETLENKEYLQMFVKSIRSSLEKQEAEVNKTIECANKFYALNFENVDNFDVKIVKTSLKPLASALKKSLFDLALDSDDIIEVFPIQVKDFISSINTSIKDQKKLDALLANYNVKSIYDLPSETRAKLKEVIISKEDKILELEQTTSTLINHLKTIASKKSDVEIYSLAKQTLEFYLNKFFDKESSLSKSQAKKEALKLLADVGIPEPERRYEQYPFEFSGGMRQRIVIAIALSSNPEVLICDEPTTALDVTIQSQILELIQKLKVEKNLSIIFITHDLGVVANMADDIAVMYAGKIVEYGTVYDIFYDPRHPYTWALLGSMPDLKTKERLNAIPGTPPNMLLPPKGDAFALRNVSAVKEDFISQPPFFKVSNTHYAATWLLHPLAPDVKVPLIVSKRIEESLKASNNKNKPVPENYKNSVLNYIGGIHE